MTTIEKIEKAVAALSAADLAAWFEAFQADHWDRRLEHDVATGKLDSLAEAALSDHRAGRTSRFEACR